MHTSTLFALLPLLAALPAMSLPHYQGHIEQKFPLPALLRRQEPATGAGALELPPSLNNLPLDPSASLSLSIADDPQPTAMSTPSIWQINTVPQTLLAQPQAEALPTDTLASVPTAGVTAGGTGDMYIQDTSEEDLSANDISTPTPTGMVTVEYQGDSLLEATSISVAGMDITAAAAAITSMAGVISSGVASGTITSFSAVAMSTSTSTGTSAMASTSVGSTSAAPSAISTSISTASSTAVAAAEITSTDSLDAAAASASSSASTTASQAEDKDQGKKIRYKHCAETKGTVTEIKVNPCEGGKGTILDPCHFQAGKNYTITLTYVSPEDSSSPRANLVARDKTMSDGQQHFTYPGQAFDACQYTTCPIKNQETKSYTYEFATMNNRFDQLTFNMTNGLDGDSLMCAYFPVTFMPTLAGRSVKRNMPFGGLGARW
ncbi:hypothetical protein I302_101083 [Kwoniella bestiolae CBS 10118]|uniref:Phosphatidylglycerol/phosphatidylinositol transfer protein n=1 Tax=Kwoniella bestiolae CBS 10118 TaxID=1296100 RepID=A0A1B9G707_9TREE|nr:hypothetical protein I302_04459 [Kwoniella bestiolae CBS 10118]OCF26770.1 hypothetical protein I302_04459 [Kwoniella bestiolae CBS 10118]